ncbi:MAG TPA: hypothetical protein VFM90_03295, partial [Cyclobacteriaceae bacterium]|nr:hypothetical protein [Cyclobacteriaceae bacterium]
MDAGLCAGYFCSVNINSPFYLKVLAMRFVQFSIMIMLASATLLACKKDKAPSASNAAIEGKWSGKYGFDTETPTIFYGFNIKPGGVLEEF